MRFQKLLVLTLIGLCFFFICTTCFFYFTEYEKTIQKYGLGSFIRVALSKVTNSSEENLEIENLDIILTEEDLQSLGSIRERSLRAGYIGNDLPNPYVRAKIHFGGKNYNCKLRLKGDFLDHIMDEKKWSLKIKLQNGNKLFGMKEFAIQKPEVRNGYGEYVYHLILNSLGFPSIYYDFINVSVNGNQHGLYAIEGRFNEDFFKLNNIAPQPILRFNDQRFFTQKRKISGKAENNVVWSDWSTYSARIDCHELKDVLSDTLLKQNLEKGASMLEGFRKGNLKTNQVFDLDKLAIFYALSDLFGAYHAQQFPNLRYYYNDEKKLLEPIGFDANGLSDIDVLFAQELQFYGTNNFGGKRFEHRLNWILLDIGFLEKYHKILLQMSERAYIDSIIKISENKLNQRQKVAEYLNFNWDVLWNNQKVIQSALDPTNALEVNAVQNDSGVVLNVHNGHYIGIEVIDLVDKNGNVIGTPKNTKYVFGRNKNHHSIFQRLYFNKIKGGIKKSYLRYKVIGLNKVYSQKLHFWDNTSYAN